jgi:hypothetical protein
VRINTHPRPSSIALGKSGNTCEQNTGWKPMLCYFNAVTSSHWVHSDSSRDGSERLLDSPESQCSVDFQPVVCSRHRTALSKLPPFFLAESSSLLRGAELCHSSSDRSPTPIRILLGCRLLPGRHCLLGWYGNHILSRVAKITENKPSSELFPVKHS